LTSEHDDAEQAHWHHGVRGTVIKAPTPETARRFGPFVLASPVRTGQPSRLYRALRPGIDGEVFLRILDPRPDSAHALAELRRLVPLVHPNIVRVLEAGVWEQQLYTVLEPWPGELDREPTRSSEQKLALVTGLCAGLAAAHAAGLVHGDLHLRQIHLAPDGAARLDFSDRSPLMIGGLMARNASLLAPEVIRGGALDQRADVFMAASLCYEVLTDRRPFGDDGPMQVWLRTVNEEPRLDAVPPPLADWLRRALAKDPAARFATGAEMSEALKGAVER
jgi:serine/threonine protein kinase